MTATNFKTVDGINDREVHLADDDGHVWVHTDGDVKVSPAAARELAGHLLAAAGRVESATSVPL